MHQRAENQQRHICSSMHIKVDTYSYVYKDIYKCLFRWINDGFFGGQECNWWTRPRIAIYRAVAHQLPGQVIAWKGPFRFDEKPCESKQVVSCGGGHASLYARRHILKSMRNISQEQKALSLAFSEQHAERTTSRETAEFDPFSAWCFSISDVSRADGPIQFRGNKRNLFCTGGPWLTFLPISALKWMVLYHHLQGIAACASWVQGPCFHLIIVPTVCSFSLEPSLKNVFPARAYNKKWWSNEVYLKSEYSSDNLQNSQDSHQLFFAMNLYIVVLGNTKPCWCLRYGLNE